MGGDIKTESRGGEERVEGGIARDRVLKEGRGERKYGVRTEKEGKGTER